MLKYDNGNTIYITRLKERKKDWKGIRTDDNESLFKWEYIKDSITIPNIVRVSVGQAKFPLSSVLVYRYIYTDVQMNTLRYSISRFNYNDIIRIL